MKILSRCLGLVVALFAFSSRAIAHPGHGEPGVTHYVVEPVHQLQFMTFMIAITVLAGLILLSIVRKRISQ